MPLYQDVAGLRGANLLNRQNPWLLIPALFVIAVVLAFNFVGDGLRDAADPYK